MNVPDLFTVALIFVTALVCAVFTSVVTVWLNNRDAWQRGWHEGWNEHAAMENEVAEAVAAWGSKPSEIVDSYTERQRADLIAYHTGGDTVADLRPLMEADAAHMNAAVQMPAPVDVPNDWPWNPDE